MRYPLLLAFGLSLGAAFSQTAHAHESRPLYIEVIEKAPLSFLARWKIPPSIKVSNAPQISMVEGCAPTADLGAAGGGRGNHRQRNFHCASDPAGTVLRIDYPQYNPSVSTLVRVSRLSGETHSLLASPDESEVTIPAVESFGGVARDYFTLGVRHILEGYDHLLFLICLLLIARTGRRMLITITGFTVAHSITLALSALGVVRVPIPAVEAAIALSIVFLAVEIVRGDPSSLTYRHPIAVSSSFGLLHGFGFAAVLGETGLPQTEIPAALLSFNLGVEFGQLVFVVGVVIAIQLLRRATRSLGRPNISLDSQHLLQTSTGYAIGVLASLWLFQRVATFWTS